MSKMWPYDEQEAAWLSKPRPTTFEIEAEARRLRAETVAWLASIVWEKVSHAVKTAVQPILKHFEDRRMARELIGMSDRDLSDIGLTRNDVSAVVDGTYRDPMGIRTRTRPIMMRLDPGRRRLPGGATRLAS
ncbi:MAG: DUF1127 domain-containing protein [Alphaproteobacteria bacterium]|nr:DUF1127 domain-containing protein [Alphaproteobacteria bacterium]